MLLIISRWRRVRSEKAGQKDEGKKEEGQDGQQKEDPKAERINLNQNFYQHSPIEAFGWVSIWADMSSVLRKLCSAFNNGGTVSADSITSSLAFRSLQV